jgi:hypothetical protein
MTARSNDKRQAGHRSPPYNDKRLLPGHAFVGRGPVPRHAVAVVSCRRGRSPDRPAVRAVSFRRGALPCAPAVPAVSFRRGGLPRVPGRLADGRHLARARRPRPRQTGRCQASSSLASWKVPRPPCANRTLTPIRGKPASDRGSLPMADWLHQRAADWPGQLAADRPRQLAADRPGQLAADELVVVLDCGATNARAVAVDTAGEVVASVSLPNQPVRQDDAPRNWRIWPLEAVFGKLAGACAEALAEVDPGRVRRRHRHDLRRRRRSGGRRERTHVPRDLLAVPPHRGDLARAMAAHRPVGAVPHHRLSGHPVRHAAQAHLAARERPARRSKVPIRG